MRATAPLILLQTRRGSLVSLISSDYPTSDKTGTSSFTDSDSSDGKEDLDEKYENKSRRLIEIKVEYLKWLDSFFENF